MSTVSEPRYTQQEYLARERSAPHKSEYYRGQIFAMAGASPNHNRLVRNLLTQLDAQLRGSGCEVFPSDLRLYCPAGLITYPDAQVVCGPLAFLDEQQDTITNPTLIVEVLSKSTERYDRGQKFELYRGLLTLKAYVLVSYREPLVERFIRQTEGGWLLTEAKGLESTIDLSVIAAQLSLAEVYRGVSFPVPPPGIWREEGE